MRVAHKTTSSVVSQNGFDAIFRENLAAHNTTVDDCPPTDNITPKRKEASPRVKEVIDKLLDRLNARKDGRNYTYYILPEKTCGGKYGSKEDWGRAYGMNILDIENEKYVMTDQGYYSYHSYLRTDRIEKKAQDYGITTEEAEDMIAVHELMHSNFQLYQDAVRFSDSAEDEALDEFHCFSAEVQINPDAAMRHAAYFAVGEKIANRPDPVLKKEVAAFMSALEKTFYKLKIKSTSFMFLSSVYYDMKKSTAFSAFNESFNKNMTEMATAHAIKTNGNAEVIRQTILDNLTKDLSKEVNRRIGPKRKNQ